MSQIVLFDKAHARIQSMLATRLPECEVVLWHADGSLTRNGSTVDVTQVSPAVAWLSGDVLSDALLEGFVQSLEQMQSLRWVQTANAGLDHPVYRRLALRGVKISKSGAQAIAIAEYVLAYALRHGQGLEARKIAQSKRLWQPRQFSELWRSRWLIVGYGHIGRNVAKRAKAFSCDTTIARREMATDEYADRVIRLAEMHDHLPTIDTVVLACPATETTRGLVDATFLRALKPGALLINIARGSLIDEAALLKGLDAGQPGHAVLDVFETEPLPNDHPFWHHESVTLTAHTSNAGSGTRGRGDELFVSNLERFAAGKQPSDVAPAGAAL